jgi:hypothetical protein
MLTKHKIPVTLLHFSGSGYTNTIKIQVNIEARIFPLPEVFELGVAPTGELPEGDVAGTAVEGQVFPSPT